MFNSFSKCTICTSLERHMTKILNPDTRAHFRKLKLEHHERQMLERSYYYKKREASRKEPTKYMSIIIDGMDQSKTNLPHFTGRLPKSLSAADLLKTHITGAICHGHGGMYSFLDINQFPHDPNLTIDVILRILEKTVTTNSNRLPPTLYLQADNCVRENKNQYVLGFCELLVKERIFNEVHLSFLPVGHTHEDIDSKFASIADSLRTKNVESVGSLLKVLEKPEEIRSLFDVRGWITPYLNKIVQITNPLYFKIKRIEDTVKGYYKGNHNDVWKILPQNLLNTLPNSKPSEVIPSFDKINIENHEKLVSSNQFMFSQDSSIADWQNFNETIKQKKYKSSPKWILPNLPRQSDLQETSPIVVPEQISSLMEKEKRQLNVKVIQKRKPTQGQPSLPVVNPKKRKLPTKTRSITTFVTILLTDEEKKHTWLKIFYEMCFSMLFMSLLLCLLMIFVLLLKSLVIEMLEFIAFLIRNLLLMHIGRLLMPISSMKALVSLCIPKLFMLETRNLDAMFV
ncbi:uncharacterized protein LOC128222654 isoform X2 [Mya arenaria]|uniref:uncharacterized protein LOC128222654 isoform X2 n=1 Tax=Mya arenaria TaxID=6604 RepID=UPI0022E7983B|nr:uncharacterized protein LOC128222654 isoform X2 [Mya arenaria]